MLVSIITVVYNGAETIEKTILSVLNQTYTDIEYIVVDGCSSDNTVAIAKSYVDKFIERGMSINVISEKDNGMYEALNKGIRLSHGELVGQINSDDWYELTAVEDMVNLFENEHYDIAWASLNVLTPLGKKIKRAFYKPILTTAGFSHPTMFTRREVLLEYPYACRDMDDDFDMVLRVKKGNKKIAVLNKPLANYVVGGMSTEKSIKNSFHRVKMKYSTYRRNGYTRFSLFYCIAVELVKYIFGG